MKAILKRVGSLERELVPQADLPSLHLAALREDQRRRQLEAKANGQFYEESSLDDKAAASNRWLAIEERLRIYQAGRSGRRSVRPGVRR